MRRYYPLRSGQAAMTGENHLESRTREIGQALLRHARSDRRGGDSWLQKRAMQLGMSDERVKTQLFRFVDALPALTSSREVNSHLRQYLGPVAGRLPGLTGRAIHWIPRDGLLGRGVAGVAQLGARTMARRFIAASDVPAHCGRFEGCGAGRLASRWICWARRSCRRPRRNSTNEVTWRS